MQYELRQLLAEEVLLPVVNKSGTHIVTVKETGVDAKLKQVEILGLAQGDLAFTLDHQPSGKAAACFKQLSCYLSVQHNKINKGCDFVLFTEHTGRLCVLLGELKSNKPKARDLQEQLRNSELFIRYLFSLAKECHGVDREPDFRKICVHTGKSMAKKRPVRRKVKETEVKDHIHFYSVRSSRTQLLLRDLLG